MAKAVELSPRWYPLRAVPEQAGYVHSKHRYIVLPAGRRSGKTERAKRKLAKAAMGRPHRRVNHNEAPRYFAAAPTRQQAKQIYWEDLKALTRPYWAKRPMESELSITLTTGAQLLVFGMDKPERFEGQPWDGGVLDEFANMKPDAWTLHVRPALSDRLGWCDMIGVPEGRNHYWQMYTKALARMQQLGERSEWAAYTWSSSAVLPPSEIAAAREDLDPRSFEQEYEASFVNFEGRAYYAFTDNNKRALRQFYNPNVPLIFCFDFNVAPGVAVVCQPMRLSPTGDVLTCVIGEVWIDDNSNTELVCRRLLRDWQGHLGRVEVYGDASGGARGTAKVTGSDWEIVKAMLRDGDPVQNLRGFGHAVQVHVPPANPAERARVNAMNSRLCTLSGDRRLLVDPIAAPHVVADLEGVQLVKGGSGEIDKKKNKALTHISDALGYYVVARFPIAPTGVGFSNLAA